MCALNGGAGGGKNFIGRALRGAGISLAEDQVAARGNVVPRQLHQVLRAVQTETVRAPINFFQEFRAHRNADGGLTFAPRFRCHVPRE